MNMPPVDKNFQFRTLRSRNIPYDTRHRQIDRQTSRGQEPDIPPRSSSLKMHSKMTPDLLKKLPSTSDKTIGNTFKQDSLKLPIPTPRYERYTQEDQLNIPLPQISIYTLSMREQKFSLNLKC